MSHAPVSRPPERYGDLRPARHRRLARVLTGVLAVVATGWFIWMAVGISDRDVRWQDVGFRLQSSNEVAVTFDVTVYEGTSATCTIRALNSRYAVVGQVQVPVETGGERTVRREVDVLTSEQAVTGGVDTCTVP